MTEAEIRAAHPDWTDEQVAAEVARLAAQPPPPEPPAPPAPEPPKPDPDRDRAMAEMRRRTEQAERDAKAARDALAERERKEAEERGEWQKVAEQEKQRREQAEADKQALEAKITAAEQRNHAERAAGERKFADTGYALYLLEQQKVDFADAANIASALDQLKESRPDLLSTPPAPTPPPPSGGPTGGPTPPPAGLTAEQIKAMPPTEVQKLMATPEGAAAVNAALAAQ